VPERRSTPAGDSSENDDLTVNVLAVGAHPLDVFFLCGGTLARYARSGHSVFIAVVCQPAAESATAAVEQVAALSETDTGRAASLIGATVDYLRVPAFSLRDDLETSLRVTEVVRRAQPDVILTHDPADYYSDHQQTSETVSTAAIMSRQVTIETESPPLSPRHCPEVIFMDTISGLGFEPEEFVDITEDFDMKRRMIECYESEVAQWRDDPVFSWLEWLEVNSRYRGIQSGVRCAEAFRRANKWGVRSTKRLLP
jgi:LmbE family N-acetylglucosaminyl deacetylase